MAICPKCKLEISNKVLPMHLKRCGGIIEEHNEIEEQIDNPENELEQTEEEIRQQAKDLGIKSWHVKSIDRLKEEISEVM